MRVLLLLSLCTLLIGQNAPKVAAGANNSNAPEYTVDGRLIFPSNYREWIYLTTGIDMDYNPDLMAMDYSMFDNVFVNPEAYKAFVATGTWPDKTMLVLEGRMATSKGSINKKGKYRRPMLWCARHIKDMRPHFPGKWAFSSEFGR